MKPGSRQLKLHLLLTAAAAGIFIVSAGVLYYLTERKATILKQHETLSAIARLKTSQIEQWHRERLSEALFFTAFEPYSTYALELLKGDTLVSPVYLSSLSHIMTNNRYSNIYITNKEGEVIFSMGEDKESRLAFSTEQISNVFETGHITEKDFFLDPGLNGIFYDILAPIKDEGGKVLACVVFRVNPEENLFPIIQNWPVPSKTAETLLARADNGEVIILNHLLNIPNSALTLRIPLTDTNNPSVMAVSGKTGMFEGIDYHNKEVVADLGKISNTPWFIVVKIDKEELFQDFRKRSAMIVGLTLLAVLLVSIMILWIYHIQQRNIYRQLLQKSRELYQSQEQFRAILYSIGDAVITTDHDRKIMNMNKIAEKLTGWTELESRGKRYDEVFRTPDSQNLEKEIKSGDSDQPDGITPVSALHTRLQTRNGEIIYVTVSEAPVRNEKNETEGFVIIFRDKTEERRILKMLEENERYYREMYEHSPVAYHSLDMEANIMEVNAKWLEMLGYEREEVIGTSLNRYLAPESRIRLSGRIDKLKDAGQLLTGNYEFHTKSGEIISVVSNGRITTDRIGNPFRTHCVLTNITERVKLENELISAKEKAEESERLKTAFLANMSHEIRTPMNGILGFTQMLSEPGLTEDQIHEYIDIVNKSGMRLLDTINDIIEISKIESGEARVVLSDVNVEEVMQYHLGFFRPQANLKKLEFTLKSQVTGESAKIRTDKYKLNSILTNLIRNAIKFTDGGGIEIGNYVDGENLCFFVKDSGIGIPEERQAAIFERFVQADYKLSRTHEGSGLGLAIARAYAESLGGSVSVVSAPGKGSTFTCILPYSIRSIQPEDPNQKNDIQTGINA